MRDIHPVLAGGPLLIAHRGGAGLAPENTLFAFRKANDEWPIDMIECDVRATRDGHCVVIHDDTLDRTTDGTGPVSGYTLEELRRFDFGYRFTSDGAKTFPFRGQGITISTIDEVFDALPEMRFTIEVKIGAAQAGLFDAIRKFNATERVIAAGMHDRDRTAFGDYTGQKSGSTEEMKRFYMMHRIHMSRLHRPPFNVVQAPEYYGDRHVATARFVRDLRRKNVPVHIWTVNDETSMDRLLDIGVDGLITDRPDIGARVLAARGRKFDTRG